MLSAPIEEAGPGEWFRHRMGHGVGLDIHELPFISVENETPLEAGMPFTGEPSIVWPDHFGVRIEDVVVCAEGGGRRLNTLSTAAIPTERTSAGNRRAPRAQVQGRGFEPL